MSASIKDATVMKFVKFLAVGIPAFLVAIPFNIVLVENYLLPKPVAYAVVLLFQVTINFFACIVFVFTRDNSRTLAAQYMLFLSGILSARALDWALYSVFVSILPVHYLVVQVVNVVIFSVAKYGFARTAIEGVGKN